MKEEQQNKISNFRMFRMHEHGLQDRHNSRMYTKKPRCSGSAGNFITASLVDTKPAIVVLLWGICLAICLLAIELTVNRIKLRKNNGETSKIIR